MWRMSWGAGEFDRWYAQMGRSGLRDQIARRAYEIWVQSGYPTGRDTENWAQAELELSTGCGAVESSAQQA